MKCDFQQIARNSNLLASLNLLETESTIHKK